MSTKSASDDVCSETLRRMITSVSGGEGGSSSEVSAHAIRMQPDFCEHTDGLHSTVQAYYACVELIRPRLSKLWKLRGRSCVRDRTQGITMQAQHRDVCQPSVMNDGIIYHPDPTGDIKHEHIHGFSIRNWFEYTTQASVTILLWLKFLRRPFNLSGLHRTYPHSTEWNINCLSVYICT